MVALARQTESPIEEILVDAIRDEIGRIAMTAKLTTQAAMGPYRIDILVQANGKSLVVECDGAAYHAASKEQVERDKRRDRYFAARDISVMRFTGSEINRSARACAAEVGGWIEAGASALKASIMAEYEQGKITRLKACRLIRRLGLVSA
jgi:very-short-patch-repair endonuclease